MSPEIRGMIQESLDFIEQNLRCDITAQELASRAGFSMHHYYHVFKAVMGMSVGRYITHRRLLHAIWNIAQGQDAIGAALEYGFDTHAGFYNAFRKEFGCSPTRYLQTHRAARPPRISLKEEMRMIDTKIITRALEAWGMENTPVNHLYYANTGFQSEHTFAVGSQHCIKVSNCMGELQQQAALQRELMKQGIAAPIVPTLAQQDILEQDDMFFMLSERVQGQPVKAKEMMENPESARALGEGLARLHAALKNCDPLLCQQEDYAATMRYWAIPTARPYIGQDTAWMDAFQNRVEATFPTLPVQIIHRDPNPDNILMQDGRVVGFVDFELTRVLPRIFDICYAATGILSVVWQDCDEQKRLRFFDVARSIWQGYNAVVPLTDAEWAALPDMVIGIELTCVAAFAGSDRFAHQFDMNQHMLQFILQHMNRFN